jgi:hypothetical protein
MEEKYFVLGIDSNSSVAAFEDDDAWDIVHEFYGKKTSGILLPPINFYRKKPKDFVFLSRRIVCSEKVLLATEELIGESAQLIPLESGKNGEYTSDDKFYLINIIGFSDFLINEEKSVISGNREENTAVIIHHDFKDNNESVHIFHLSYGSSDVYISAKLKSVLETCKFKNLLFLKPYTLNNI